MKHKNMEQKRVSITKAEGKIPIDMELDAGNIDRDYKNRQLLSELGDKSEKIDDMEFFIHTNTHFGEHELFLTARWDQELIPCKAISIDTANSICSEGLDFIEGVAEAAGFEIAISKTTMECERSGLICSYKEDFDADELLEKQL